MRARRIIRRHLGSALRAMHKKRVKVLLDAILCLIHGGRLSVSAWGRALPRKTHVKHRIKCIDRLLSNKHLQKELDTLTQVHISHVLGNIPKPRLLVDWTQLSETHWALSASVASHGRSVPLYQRVFGASQLGHRRSHRMFLRGLQACLPRGCCPILITDAGFHNVFFQEVLLMGWDFVARLGKGVTFEPSRTDIAWLRMGTLFCKARKIARSFGVLRVAKSNPIFMQLVLYKGRTKRRHGCKKVTPKGVHPGSTSYKKYQRRGREPWVLGTSLHHASAKRIVNHYACRMQCEEVFRDLKNHRYGLCFEDVRCRTIKRINILLFIVMLAMLVATLVGCIAEHLGIHRRFQANTEKTRRVVSRFLLGLLILRENSHPNIADTPRLKDAYLHLISV